MTDVPPPDEAARALAIWSYVKNRLRERSTWLGLSAAVVGNYMLPVPFNYIAITLGCIAVLVPTGGGK